MHTCWCVLGTVPHAGNSVLRGDAVIRAMMWVVTRHMHGRVSVYVKCIVLNFCYARPYCGWAEMSFLQVH